MPRYGLVYPGVGWLVWRARRYVPESLIFQCAPVLHSWLLWLRPATHAGVSSRAERAQAAGLPWHAPQHTAASCQLLSQSRCRRAGRSAHQQVVSCSVNYLGVDQISLQVG